MTYGCSTIPSLNQSSEINKPKTYFSLGNIKTYKPLKLKALPLSEVPAFQVISPKLELDKIYMP